VQRTIFSDWAAKHGKTYANAAEFDAKFAVFQANHAFITAANQEGRSYKLAHNEFSDMTHEEFKASMLGQFVPNHDAKPFTHGDVKLSDADSVDWRTSGAVTDVKNQGQCGSCWAFSTTGSIEGAHQIATGNLVSLSEQELVDCDRAQDQGCNGGLMDNAFAFVEKNGLASETDYPYTAQDGQCDTAAEAKPAATISSFSDVTVGSEDALRQAVKMQPVSIAIEADQQGFQFYSSGVFSGECGQQLDHGVLVVGYTYTAGNDDSNFWIVKNSWGATWGEEGYIRLAYGQNQCGLTNAASYPVV